MTNRKLSLIPLALLASTLFAQESATPAIKETPAGPPSVVISLSFPGGTMADFVDLVRNHEPKVNIVVAAAAADAKLPAIDLRGAGLGQAMEAACSVATSEWQIRVKDFRGPGETVYSVMATPGQKNTAGSGGDRKEVVTVVLSLNNLTADADRNIGFAAASILSCIETAANGQGGVPVLRYHKDTGLLIVTGNADQIGIAEAVLRNLDKDVDVRRRREASANAVKAVNNQPKEK